MVWGAEIEVESIMMKKQMTSLTGLSSQDLSF
jgi:hypothetical protein